MNLICAEMLKILSFYVRQRSDLVLIMHAEPDTGTDMTSPKKFLDPRFDQIRVFFKIDLPVPVRYTFYITRPGIINK